MTREEVIKQLKYCKSIHNGSFGPALKIAIKALEQESKTGHWIDNKAIKNLCNCSECGGLSKAYTRYCPNCGIKMEVEE